MLRSVTTFAPGRVEVLGNHTDYNGGYVLSAAIHLGVTTRGVQLPDGELHVSSRTNHREVRAKLNDLHRLENDGWANYPIGVVDVMQHAGFPLGGMELEISSDLPVGAGLSSSAALEVATAMATKVLFDLVIDPMELAKLCQKAENEFVGVQCGLLDHVSSVFGKANELILIDFQTLTVETVPLPRHLSLLLFNSGVPHELVGGEYNERRQQCARAARLLSVSTLREVTPEQVRNADLDDVTRRRALHITEENERVLQSVAALRSGHIERFGELMFASHDSSRVNFENSTRYLDALVDITKGMPGVFGSRITGGGFGGSIVCLIQPEHSAEIIEAVSERYHERTGATCSPILTEPSQGARVV
jgi:galactokinase